MKTVIRFVYAIFVVIAFLLAMGCASTQQHEGTGEYMDDSIITGKVKAAILDDPSLSSAEINVETFKGEVQLSGFVNSNADINRAMEVTRTVNGVKSIKNDMHKK